MPVSLSEMQVLQICSNLVVKETAWELCYTKANNTEETLEQSLPTVSTHEHQLFESQASSETEKSI